MEAIIIMRVQEISQQNIGIKRGLILLGGWISAVVSLFVYPFVFGMVGVISGILATKNEKSRLGVFLIVASILLMGAGLAFSTRILSSTKGLFGF
jgi:hypothetical protein